MKFLSYKNQWVTSVNLLKSGILQTFLKRQYETMSSQIFSAPCSLLEKWAKLSVTQPLSKSVYANDSEYFASTGVSKLGWRQFRRAAYYGLCGHANNCHQHIQPHWKRGLWLYKGISQIGDALMDLAPRDLLTANGLAIDLLSDIHICELFEGDSWFGQVFSSIDLIQDDDYDFVIMPSNKRRSLSHKRGPLAKLPWVSMHGFYTGPEFNRADFAAQRLFDALGIMGTPDELQSHARQKLVPLISPRSSNHTQNKSPVKIAFALGGVDRHRTYSKWESVALSIVTDKPIDLTLLGSSNAIQAADKFLATWPYRLTNMVDKTNLTQCRKIINEQDLLIASDGGLMHLGITTKTKLISLFPSNVHPEWRLPKSMEINSITSTSNNVNDIDADIIANKIMQEL